MLNFLTIDAATPSLQPPIVFWVGQFPVTSSFLMILLIVFLTGLVGIIISRSAKQIPGTFQSIVELLYEGMESLVNQITRSRKTTEKIFPLIAALFLFVGVSNLIGLIPGITSIQFDGVELFRSPTSDFNTTFALATAMVLLVQWISIRDWGLFGYIGKFVQIKEVVQGFRKSIGDGAIAFINFLIGLLDVISEIAKVVSLSMRLFGNIYAGEILAVIILGGLAYGLPAVWMGMNMFVGVIQALVFGALVAAYYTLAQRPEDDR